MKPATGGMTEIIMKYLRLRISYPLKAQKSYVLSFRCDLHAKVLLPACDNTNEDEPYHGRDIPRYIEENHL